MLERYFSWKVYPYLVNVCMANENFYRNGYLVADKAGAAKAGERFGALLARTAALVPGRMVLFTIPGCAEFFNHPLLLDLGLDLNGIAGGELVYRIIGDGINKVPGLESLHLAQVLRDEVACTGMDWEDLFFRWDFHYKPNGNELLADGMCKFLLQSGVMDRAVGVSE